MSFLQRFRPDFLATLFSFAKKRNISVLKFWSMDIQQNCRLPLSEIATGKCRNLFISWIRGTLGMLLRMNGLTFGARVNVPQNKLISNFIGLFQLPPSSNGCGNHLCSPSKSFSFGYFWGIGLTLETCSKGKNKYLPSCHCELCVHREEETLLHLFFECPFSQACSIYLGIQWDLSQPPLDMMLT